MTHAHHDHTAGPTDLTAASARRVLTGIVAAVAVLTIVGVVVLWPRGEPAVDREALGYGARVDATVVTSQAAPCSYDAASECTVVTAEVTSGPDAGTTASIEASRESRTPASMLGPGDEIVLNDAGTDVPPESRYSFADRQRGMPLVALAVLFAVAVVVLGRLRGLLALAGIALSAAVLLVYMFPALLDGTSPVGVALTSAVVIAFGTLYLAHGVSDRTTVALLGTLVSLGLTAGLAALFAGVAELSGLASEESTILLSFAPELDFRGMLLAAIIIGTLGVLDDVTVTQVAAVWELHRSDPEADRRQLYRAGVRIGRDHIASTVNTLVLAYTAAALPLLLLFTQSGLPLGGVLTSETVAVEIVQTLVGSIGLVASVPITTALACWMVTRPDGPAEDEAYAGYGDHGGPVGYGADGWRAPQPHPQPPLPPQRRPQPQPEPEGFWWDSPGR